MNWQLFLWSLQTFDSQKLAYIIMNYLWHYQEFSTGGALPRCIIQQTHGLVLQYGGIATVAKEINQHMYWAYTCSLKHACLGLVQYLDWDLDWDLDWILDWCNGGRQSLPTIHYLNWDGSSIGLFRCCLYTVWAESEAGLLLLLCSKGWIRLWNENNSLRRSNSIQC